MTALAMIIGMVPMAVGLGEGGEQNAPLGRAVIGGLIFATFATLFFVPCVFSMIHGRRQRRSEEHTSELQSRLHLVCRLLLEKKKYSNTHYHYSEYTQIHVL